MKTNYYSIFDSKAEAYLPPFASKTHATALRSLEMAVDNEQHDLYRFAQDYTLYQVSVFDEETGLFEAMQPKSIVDVWVVKAKIQNAKNLQENPNNG